MRNTMPQHDGPISTSAETTNFRQEAGLERARIASIEEEEVTPLVFDSDRDSLEEKGLLPAAEQVDEKKDAVEYTISTRTKLLYLAGYFALNLTLTLSNKLLLNKFPYPWLLTTIHSTCTTIGCLALLFLGHFKLSSLSYRENLILAAYSTLFTANIAMSNISLAQVSIAFHQIARSTCPAFAVLFYRVIFSRKYSSATYWSLVPIITGVIIATYGDQFFTVVGFILTFSGVILAVIKTITTNKLLTGSLKLPTLELLFRMSPLAAVQTITFAAASGEITRLSANISGLSLPLAFMLLANGVVAFVLNVSSFQTNKLAGALTLTVAGNLKQCLTIILGITIAGRPITVTNALGITVALCGAAWYSRVELAQKR